MICKVEHTLSSVFKRLNLLGLIARIPVLPYLVKKNAPHWKLQTERMGWGVPNGLSWHRWSVFGYEAGINGREVTKLKRCKFNATYPGRAAQRGPRQRGGSSAWWLTALDFSRETGAWHLWNGPFNRFCLRVLFGLNLTKQVSHVCDGFGVGDPAIPLSIYRNEPKVNGSGENDDSSKVLKLFPTG